MCILYFTLTEIIGGNSYLAVYIAGLVVGNKRLAVRRTIVTFFGGFTWLVQIIMFLTLGLLVNPHELLHVVVPGIALGIFIMLVARPVAVFLSLLLSANIHSKVVCIYHGWDCAELYLLYLPHMPLCLREWRSHHSYSILCFS